MDSTESANVSSSGRPEGGIVYYVKKYGRLLKDLYYNEPRATLEDSPSNHPLDSKVETVNSNSSAGTFSGSAETSESEPQSSHDDNQTTIDALPDSILLSILQIVAEESKRDLMENVRYVCEKWFKLCQDPSVWNWELRFLCWAMELDDIEDALSYVQGIPNISLFLDRNYYEDKKECWGKHNFKGREEDVYKRLDNEKILDLFKTYVPDLKILFIKEYVYERFSATKEFFDGLSDACPELEVLKLHRINRRKMFKPYLFDGIKQLVNLKHLEFRICYGVNGGQLRRILPTLPYLERLVLESGDIPANAFEVIAEHAPNLKSLSLMAYHHYNETDIDLEHTKHLFRLVSLEALRFQLPVPPLCLGETLKGICSELKNLKRLELKGEDVTDEVIMIFAPSAKRLHYFQLENCKAVTDIAVLQLADQLRYLSHLQLQECNGITDLGLTRIAKHARSLKTLVVKYCDNVTDKGINLFKESRPETKCIYLYNFADSATKELT